MLKSFSSIASHIHRYGFYLNRLGLMSILGAIIFWVFMSHARAGDIIRIVDEKRVYGKVEWVRFLGKKEKIKTKLDTGAYISSLNAVDIEMFKKDDKQWVRFTVVHEKYQINLKMEKPVVRLATIKNRSGERNGAEKVSVEKRPVINMTLCIGGKKVDTEVNLVDRSHFIYPMLLGAETIMEMQGVVDPSRKFTAKSKACDL